MVRWVIVVSYVLACNDFLWLVASYDLCFVFMRWIIGWLGWSWFDSWDRRTDAGGQMGGWTKGLMVRQIKYMEHTEYSLYCNGYLQSLHNIYSDFINTQISSRQLSFLTPIPRYYISFLNFTTKPDILCSKSV